MYIICHKKDKYAKKKNSFKLLTSIMKRISILLLVIFRTIIEKHANSYQFLWLWFYVPLILRAVLRSVR